MIPGSAETADPSFAKAVRVWLQRSIVNFGATRDGPGSYGARPLGGLTKVYGPVRGGLFACILLINSPPALFAHKEDYIDETLVYLTLGARELEPEYWFDYGYLRDEHREFTRQTLSAEYGLTDHWMVEGRGTMEKIGGDGLKFDSARLETRYRFYDEGALPVDIAVSTEGNVERDEKGIDRYGLEPRLILSHDFQKLNLTLNLAEEIPFDSRRDAFNVSSGFRYDAAKHFSFGCELKDDVNNHEAAVVPQMWLLLPHDLTLKAGFSYGFDHNKEQFLRVVIEKGF